MNTSISGPQDVFAKLAPLFPVLYAALEAATHETREFFDAKGKRIDRYLAPCLVRYFGKAYLLELGQRAHYEEDDVGNLANNGLALTYADYQLRILKADLGQPPAPGHSRKKQAFYHQQKEMVFGDLANKQAVLSQMNLIVLWDVDAAYDLKPLSLACPMAGLVSRASVEVHWQEEIPYINDAATAADEDHVGEEDLALRLKKGDQIERRAQ